MSRFFDVTYSEKGAVFGLIDRTFIVAILILSFEPEGPGFRPTSPASNGKIVILEDGQKGGYESNLQLKHTFLRDNFVVTKIDNMRFVIDDGW